MNFTKSLVFILLGAVFWSSPGFSDYQRCENLIKKLVAVGSSSGAKPSRLEEIESRTAQGSLLDVQADAGTKKIHAHNLEIKGALKDPLSGDSQGRRNSVSREEADFFVKLMANHPINGAQREAKYDPDECFGFCFGRASLIHSEAIRRNIDPSAIRKIWAVGSLENEKWHFHVSTLLKAKGRGSWWATDTIYKSTVSVETWMSRMENSSDTNRLMFFVTDPRRFSVYDPRFYNAIDLLGDGQSDYYNGYFRDYFEFVGRKK